jgi:hypothetical protein
MTLRLELTPEIEASLISLANAEGIPLETYIQHAIEGLAQTTTSSVQDLHELRSTLDKLAEMGQNLPHTPSSAFSRESIYQDHN